MATRMLIDATHPEETRVVVVKGTRLEEFDFETSTKRPLKGNIYLAKVTRVEPSLQAAFVEYGGNRHGFLAFGEIHPDYYQIPIADRQALLERQAAEDAKAAAEEDAADEVAAANEAAGGDPVQYAQAHPDDEIEHAGHDDRTWDDQVPADDDPTENGVGEPHRDDHQVAHRADDVAPDDSHREPQTAEPVPEIPEFPAYAEPTAAPLVASQDVLRETDAAGNADVLPAAESDGGTEDTTAETDARLSEGAGEATSGEPRPSGSNGEVVSVGGDDLDEVVAPRRLRPIRSYKIQEVIKRRQIMLVQVVKEERGNKGAALTTFLSLAGRYCVLMPNTARGGGISRKIVSASDRKRLKNIVEELEVPDGMGVILRTAGMDRSKAEIKRDFEYLLRLWDNVRELTLKSTAPCLVYEEGSLIKRAIRDYYSGEIDEILVEGEEAYRTAKDFMRMLMPSHAKKVQPYRDRIHLMHRFQVEQQFDSMYSPTVQLKSGGYIVINPTEALVAIDVNSGKSTREHNIEETAYKTNLEAAEEIARQLRLRDLAGLIVIDFIDMQDGRNNRNVERRMKECLKADRARLQVGRISAFGLLEMSRQRLRPSLLESSTEICAHCQGKGYIRSTESAALHVLRAIEDEGMRDRSSEITVYVSPVVAIYLLNHKRDAMREIEERYVMRVIVEGDNELVPPAHRIERQKTRAPGTVQARPINTETVVPVDLADEDEPEVEIEAEAQPHVEASSERDMEPEREGESPPAGGNGGEDGDRKRRRRRRRRRRVGEDGAPLQAADAGGLADEQPHVELPLAAAHEGAPIGDDLSTDDDADIVHPGQRHLQRQQRSQRPVEQPAHPIERTNEGPPGESEERRRRRRGRRGGKRRRRDEVGQNGEIVPAATQDNQPQYGAEGNGTAAPEPAAWRPTEPVETIEHRFAAPEPVFETLAGPTPEPVPVPLAVVLPEPAVAAPPASAAEPVASEPAGPPKRGWWRRRSE